MSLREGCKLEDAPQPPGVLRVPNHVEILRVGKEGPDTLYPLLLDHWTALVDAGLVEEDLTLRNP
eukprot:CAMPEP_0170630950 /NCGR_PEP_ID=MMETSP0224-20130122/34316_1 /TAXON_ID=285029 /ORGANISM="Togula jolla, Strain CCCM 725" /LENGTH=64 /DNA_ID=CAMNT_0010959127 /DNA_START=46 /DNA_END=240 /DNA_ORIENTATION=-